MRTRRDMVLCIFAGVIHAYNLFDAYRLCVSVAKLHRLCLDEQEKYSGSNMLSPEPVLLTAEGQQIRL